MSNDSTFASRIFAQRAPFPTFPRKRGKEQKHTTNFRHPGFDKLYEEARQMPISAARNAKYREMNRITAALMPWIPQTHRIRNEVWQPWVVGYRKHPIYNQVWMYMDIDETKRVGR